MLYSKQRVFSTDPMGTIICASQKCRTTPRHEGGLGLQRTETLKMPEVPLLLL